MTDKIDLGYDYTELHWQSDWNGDEVGYPEYDVIGLYTVPNFPISCYVDTETGYIVEVWLDPLN